MIRDMGAGAHVRRLWTRDATLWTGFGRGDWLGWLGITDDQIASIDHLHKIQADAKQQRRRPRAPARMGGRASARRSSDTSARSRATRKLHVAGLDGSGADQAFEQKVDLASTLFVVRASRAAPSSEHLQAVLLRRAREVVGPDRVAHPLHRITDPGSKLQRVAEADRFRHVFFGLPSIGGRFIGVSDFDWCRGRHGLDVARLARPGRPDGQGLRLVGARRVKTPARCWASSWRLARTSRQGDADHLRPRIHALGAWLGAAHRESTGKEGRGLVPRRQRTLGAPGAYGNDRLFRLRPSGVGARRAPG